jgi:2-oxoglutarate dehydrogenase E1 component
VSLNKAFHVDWTPYLGHKVQDDWDTGVSLEKIKALAAKMQAFLPDGFVVQRQVQKVLDDRVQMWSGNMELNWGAAEVMAYAKLVRRRFFSTFNRSRRWTWYVLPSSCRIA